jgi:putative oxidoreductase
MSDAARKLDIGLLVIRVGVGVAFMTHGWPKITGGPDKWAKLGGAMRHVGIDFMPTFWGFMASFAEFAGGLALALGLLFVPAAGLLAFTMLIAAIMHLSKSGEFSDASHAVESLAVFIGLMLAGPGRYAVELRRRR